MEDLEPMSREEMSMVVESFIEMADLLREHVTLDPSAELPENFEMYSFYEQCIIALPMGDIEEMYGLGADELNAAFEGAVLGALQALLPGFRMIGRIKLLHEEL